MPARIRCHVVEVPTHDDWLSRRGGGPRELLPWADPYIASLMRNLESRNGRQDRRTDRLGELSDPFADEMNDEAASRLDDGWNDGWHDDGWQEDAFMPQPLEAPQFHSYPPIYGGFPLLEE